MNITRKDTESNNNRKMIIIFSNFCHLQQKDKQLMTRKRQKKRTKKEKNRKRNIPGIRPKHINYIVNGVK